MRNRVRTPLVWIIGIFVLFVGLASVAVLSDIQTEGLPDNTRPTPIPVPTSTPVPTLPPTPTAMQCHETPSLALACRRLAFVQGTGATQTERLPIASDFLLPDAWGLAPNHAVELPHCARWDSSEGTEPPLPHSYWLYYAQPEDQPDTKTILLLGLSYYNPPKLQAAPPDTGDYIIDIGGTDYEVFGLDPDITGRLTCNAAGTVATISP